MARSKALAGLLLALVVGAARGTWAQANIPVESFWVTDDTVYGIAESGGTVYLGGAFNYVGPRTGHLARLDSGTGTPDLALPNVEGRVYTVASDGAGGWFIGGAFARVGGLPRQSLAHVLPDGRVSSWNPNPPVGSTILALAVSGRSVYVGGAFTSIGGQTRSNIAALDAATGLATSWNPSANGQVGALLAVSNLVYASGSFTNIGGRAQSRLAALDAASGSATAWSPSVDGYIAAFALSGTTLYLGGSFLTIGGQTRRYIAAVSTVTGSPTTWNPNADMIVQDLLLWGSTVYVGGSFTSIGGAARNYIAALDTGIDTNNATAWNPNADFAVNALAIAGTTLYAGGDFAAIGGQPRARLAALDTTVDTNNATSWNPGANSTVDVVVPDGASVYVGGDFSSAGGLPRRRIAAFDGTTGAPTGFDPAADGDVRTIAVSGSRVFAGGLFLDIGGQPRARIAALDAASGAAVAGWNPGADNNVLALDVSGGRVYAGGIFSVTSGQSRFDLAAYDEGTGALTSWNPVPTSTSGVNAVKVSGSTVYAGGWFDYGGRVRIVALDATTALPTAWGPNANNYVYDLAVTPSVVYAAGEFTSIGGTSRNRLASLDRAVDINNATSWNPNASSSVMAVVTGDGSVFAGGAFLTMAGTTTRNRLASFDEMTGALSAWNPNADGTVEALAFGGGKVFAGGSFLKIGTREVRGLVAFCLAAAPNGLTATPAGPGQIDLGWTGTGAASYRVYRSRFAGGPYTLLATTAATTYSDATAQGGVPYFYVVRAVDQCESDPSNEATTATAGSCLLPPDFEGLGWAEQGAGATCAVALGWAPATDPCGGGVFYSVYRNTSPAFAPSSADLVATVSAGTTYTDATPLVPGTTYYYVVRATSQATGLEETNLFRRAVTPASCTPGAPGTVEGLSVTSRSGQNVLQWVNPPGFGAVRIRYTSGASCTPPTDPLGSGTLLADDAGLPGEARRYPHTGLSDGTTYCYALFVDTGSGTWSVRRANSGRPFAPTGAVQWAFSSGIFSTAPSTVGGTGVIAANNAGDVHAMARGPAGGEWPTAWKPVTVGGPVQGRSPVVPVTVNGASPVVFLGAQDGKVYAVDGTKGGAGSPPWASPASIAGMVQAAPAGIFTALGSEPGFDYLLVGTRDDGADNAFVVLDPATGTELARYAPSLDPDRIGIVSGAASVDYGTNRVYFASWRRSAASTKSLWCLQLGTAPDPVVTLAWARDDLGDIDSSPVIRGGRLYVGSTLLGGTLHSIDMANPTAPFDRTFNHGDGQVKGFVFPDRASPGGELYFATSNRVWVVRDDGSTLTPKYPGGISLGGTVTPSTALNVPGSGFVYVGGSDGQLYEIDVSGPTPVVKPLPLGDGTALVGAPSYDRDTGLVHVGTAAGIFYAVQVPLP
jgi:hypothetical protein